MSHKTYYYKEKAKEVLNERGLLKLAGSLYGIRWGVRHWKCNVMAYCRAHGYQDRKFAALRKYAGIHENERCFIICTGPSLTLQDVEALQGETTFALNSITKIFPRTNWRPTYYVIEDMDVFLSLEDEILAAKLENCFASDLLINMLKPKVDFIAYPFDRLNHSTMRYKPSMTPRLAFSDNAYAMVYGAFTVTCSAMQLAVYMGFKEIYLIGCDCDYSGKKKHFEDFNVIGNALPVDDEEQKMNMTYEMVKEYANAHGIKICNATRGGKLEVFERVNLDKLLWGGGNLG